MRPKICLPIVASNRTETLLQARKMSELPVELVEWRVDFFEGEQEEIIPLAEEVNEAIGEKELIVTLRTEYEGGEKNGSRFDYWGGLHDLLRRDFAAYVDVEISRDEQKLMELRDAFSDVETKVIGSYHDFNDTPSEDRIIELLERARELGCDVGKLACMPKNSEDVDVLLSATAKMKEKQPDFPLITMAMGELGEKSRLYGGLYGSEVSFGCAGTASAPGQIPYNRMKEVFDKIYVGKKHIFLIGFMGVGKSSISRELAYLSRKPEIDTDEWIEKNEGQSIPEIFESRGEAYFRDAESEMLDELGAGPASIVSCGGGMALCELNIRKMQALGEVVLLTALPETIFERVKNSTNRPLLQGHMNVEYIRELMEKRRPYYERAATVQIVTDKRMLSDIAKEILEKSH